MTFKFWSIIVPPNTEFVKYITAVTNISGVI